ncbi:pseudouridine synthase, RluA family [Paenibacillus curdlanolyticus YK9]|uniref:Pseudouridine synthase n=1 Tax=Paenibacillus curdlanolyticus YK9 TaxID=717606 RepID=E0IDT5_9BACL|nr:RluA family pseudouridine synthase [Paenibacillus curdlanolyticus]EFM09289.1 pseudouridine synthase, RluA family [Paenibacillus curdlanolyticus YK9]
MKSGCSGALLEDWPKAGSSPHQLKLWLQQQEWFPLKWVNLLFSVGGIQQDGERIALDAFPPADLDKDPLYRLASEGEAGKAIAACRVLYEDDSILVMHKPAGVPVHPSRPGERGTLDEAAARHMLKKGDPLPVRHIHRLDQETSGPVLYSKNDLAQLRLDEAMRQKTIERVYLAFVQGKISKPRGVIDAPIGRDRHQPARRRVIANGDHAVTRYETMERYSKATLVRIRLETGRTHQIRVHMSHLGHPLIGDSLYGGDTALLKHQALHGEMLVFHHPLSGAPVKVFSPLPDWYAQLKQTLSQPISPWL